MEPDVAELCSMSPEELEELEGPSLFTASGGRVPQPSDDPSKPLMLALGHDFDLTKIMPISDEDIWGALGETVPGTRDELN